MMRSIAVAVLGVAVAGGFGAAEAAAQVLPFSRNDPRGARTELYSAVLSEFQDVMNRWVEAVNRDDWARAAELYTSDAVVHMAGAAVGRDDVEAHLRDWFDGAASVSFGLSQFDASSTLSHAIGTMTISRSGAAAPLGGTVVMVLRREGRAEWRIRSHTLVLGPDSRVESSRAAPVR